MKDVRNIYFWRMKHKKGATDHMDGDPYSTYIPTVRRSGSVRG